MFEEIGSSAVDIFKSIDKRELSQVEKIQEVESLVRECTRDMAYSRDERFIKSLQDNTVIMVRAGETKLKKFKQDENMYVSIPETIYDDIEELDDFNKYHKVMDMLELVLSAPEYRESNENGDLNFTEAQVFEEASKRSEGLTGTPLDIERYIERDEYGQVESAKEELFEPKRYSTKGSKPDGDEEAAGEAKEACKSDGSESGSSTATVEMQSIDDEVSQEQKEMKEMQVNQDYQAQYASQSITDSEQKVVDDIKKSCFYVGQYNDEMDYENYGILTKKVIVELDRKVKEIAKSLQGYNGKVKRITPSKRLSSKDICNDNSDRIYVGKSYVDGKHIDMNLVVEASGSMGGAPIANGIKMIYVFNKLAQQGYVDGSVLLTESSEYKMLEMPMHDDIVKAMGGTGGAEGIKKAIDKNVTELRNKNAIVMTDGDICEEPIDPKFWEKNRINCIGVYVNEDVKAEDLPGYDKNMSRWFTKTIIRNSFDEMVHKVIQLGLRASTKV